MSNGNLLAELIEVCKSQRWAKAALAAVVVIALGFASYDRWIEPVLKPGYVDIPYSQLVQLEESQRHFMQEPAGVAWIGQPTGGQPHDATQPAASISVADIAWYDSDGCVAIRRPLRGGMVTEFVLAPERIWPEEISGAGWLAEPPTRCDGECLDPHPGAPLETQVADEEDECVTWLWREWPDGCQHHQRYNLCAREWLDEEPVWDCCVHD